MAVRYLFNSSGDYVAFVQNGHVFNPGAEWIGFIRNGNEIYSSGDGLFVGYLLEDDRVAKRKNDPRKPRQLRPLRPLRPLRRLRMPRLQYPWEDVFERGIVERELSVNDIASDQSLQSLDILEGSILKAADGTYLGKVTHNVFDPDSLLNQFGDYGNPYSEKSIFNQYGTYGNPYNPLSPYNQFSRTPPRFIKDEKILAYLTANELLSSRVDPNAFRAWLEEKR